MTTEQKKSTTLNSTLWIAQIVLAISLLWAASMKLIRPADQLAAMWPWTAEHTNLVKLTGVLDLLASMGLVLPMLVRLWPQVTIYTAYGILVLMVAASIFHVLRGETTQIGVNVIFALFALFIIWGRQTKGTTLK